MKKFLTIILTVIIAINVNAQHVMFDGIELGCDPLDFCVSMENKGYECMKITYVEDRIEYMHFEGCFMGHDVDIWVNVHNDKVYELEIRDMSSMERLTNGITAKERILAHKVSKKCMYDDKKSYSHFANEGKDGKVKTDIYEINGGWCIIETTTDFYCCDYDFSNIKIHYLDATEGKKAYNDGKVIISYSFKYHNEIFK